MPLAECNANKAMVHPAQEADASKCIETLQSAPYTWRSKPCGKQQTGTSRYVGQGTGSFSLALASVGLHVRLLQAWPKDADETAMHNVRTSRMRRGLLPPAAAPVFKASAHRDFPLETCMICVLLCGSADLRFLPRWMFPFETLLATAWRASAPCRTVPLFRQSFPFLVC